MSLIELEDRRQEDRREEVITRILSIDVGIRNCAFCIEEFNKEEFQSLQKIDDKHRFSSQKKMVKIKKREKLVDVYKPTKQFKNILETAFLIGKITYWKVKDFSDDGTIKNDDNRILINAMKFLNKIVHKIDDVDIIVIERQMKNNHIARRVEGFLLSYFVMRYGVYKEILDISAARKTGYFRFKDKNKNNRKKFAVKKAKKILKLRKDVKNLDKFNGSSKKDDLADCLLQSFVFKMLVYYDKKY